MELHESSNVSRTRGDPIRKVHVFDFDDFRNLTRV
jgi:hypothetical protein